MSAGTAPNLPGHNSQFALKYPQQASQHPSGPMSLPDGLNYRLTPGSSSNGGPGPSSTAFSQGQMQQNIPPNSLPSTMTHQQQLALLQQFDRSRNSQEGQGGQQFQLDPQRLQAAMASAQGGNTDPQMLFQAMQRSGQAGFPAGMSQPHQLGEQSQNPRALQSQVNPGQIQSNPQMMQQQRVQMLMQQGLDGSSSARLGSPGAQLNQRPLTNGVMAPHPVPPAGTPVSFSLTPTQQQAIMQQRTQVQSHPNFRALPVQQQQQHLMMMQQKMVMQFSQQNSQNPVQHGSQQSLQQIQSGSMQASPSTNRQALPGQGFPQQQPMSSLPQHMAPQRPTSAAAQRAPSPHPKISSPAMRTVSATPPPHVSALSPHPTSAPSPAHSNYSYHGHHPQTPVNQHQPRPIMSPTIRRSQTPSASQQSSTLQQGGIQSLLAANLQTLSQVPSTMQQHAQNAQNMLQAGQLGNMANMGGNPAMPTPSPGIPMANVSNPSPHQQQQMAAGLGYMAPHLQANPGHGNNYPQTRPPHPAVDTLDFPFDPRLLEHVSHFNNNPTWRNVIQARNPQLFMAVLSASRMLSEGRIPLDTMRRMHQALQSSLAPPGPGPNPPPAAAQAESSLQNHGPGQAQHLGMRPPPPHLPPFGLLGIPPVPPPPGFPRKESSGNIESASNQTMPPPTWIPHHITASTGRPPIQPEQVMATPIKHPRLIVPVKEWDPLLRSDLPITDIQPLPVDAVDEAVDPTFGGALPLISELEKSQIQSWLESDKEYAKDMEENTGKKRERLNKWATKIDEELPWWSIRKGERYTPPRGRLTVVWPQDKAAQRARTTHKGRREIRFPPLQLKKMADVDDHLIPVRLDLEHDHWKLKDTFMWNCSDVVVTAEVFAHNLCDDFGLPQNHFVSKITAEINQRIHEYQNQVLPIQPKVRDDCRGKLDPEGDDEARAAFKVFRNARLSSPFSDSDTLESEEIKTADAESEEDLVEIVATDDERPMTVEELMHCALEVPVEELRINIVLNIIIGNQVLKDQFEWDIYSNVPPEEFAASYIKELGLSGEFTTAVAHDIHEQVHVHKRSLCLVGHMPGSGVIVDDEIRPAFLPALTDSGVMRTNAVAMDLYTPIFVTLPGDEILSLERERERDLKRKKRATRGRRGVVLPDRDPLKTQRTLLSLIGPSGTASNTKVDRVPTAPSAPMRRAAAIAANANINLMSQDLPIPEHASPAPPSARARPRPGRNARGLSRTSPTPALETPADEGTSSASSGLKRPMREGSVPESGASPLPRKKVNNGRIVRSPEVDVDVKMEDLESVKPEPVELKDDVGGPSRPKWHCSNCGVPEHLSGGICNDQQGQPVLCATCARHLSRTGRVPIIAYSKDEDVHRQRADAGRRDDNPSAFVETGMSNSAAGAGGPSTLPPDGADGTPHQTSSSKDSDDSDDSGDETREPVVKAIPSIKRNSDSGLIRKALPAAKPPVWIGAAVERTKQKWSHDRFVIIPRPQDSPSAPAEWRVKCLDCPGKVYRLGPGETFDNFETHLKIVAHVRNRRAREVQEARRGKP